MRSDKVITVLLACLFFAGVVWGAAMGTAFTYQGRLSDSNSVADGLYDFEFELYDAATAGIQQASTVSMEDVNVTDGYFTVQLDFGTDPNLFNGDGRWLEISVRPGASTGAYTTLSSRQELTAAPYALHTRGIFVDSNGDVGIGTRSPVAKLSVVGDGQANIGIYGTGTYFGVFGEGESTGILGTGAIGIFGEGSSMGVYGRNLESNSYGYLGFGPYAIFGDGSSYGVYGSGSVYGVSGLDTNTNASGRLGSGTFGVHGEGSTGVHGSGTGTGVSGLNTSTSTSGYLGYGTFGGYFNGDGYFSGSVGLGTPSPSYNLHVIGDIAYTGSILDISDIRLKENIAPLKNGLEKISSLKAIYFNNIGESSDNREVGVIAQDVEKLLPELVSTDKDGFKSVDYTKLTPVLIEAVKELKAENDELQEQNNRLESRLSALENAMRSGSFIGKEL